VTSFGDGTVGDDRKNNEAHMTVMTLAKGLATWIPGVHRAFNDLKTGTGTASYCYGVWMKHLVLLCEHGMRDMPRSVVELGPGSSIGTGLAALLSGAERYVGIDAVEHATADANLAVFRELCRLFEQRAPRPTRGFPAFDEYLDARLFPSRILTDERLEESLAPHRLNRLQKAVEALSSPSPHPAIRYQTWRAGSGPGDAQFDLVFSHVVMNEVEDLEGTYARCAAWLRPGGWMSHQIDFTSLDTTPEWNGHRRYGEVTWKIISGRRPYFVNREPMGTHLRTMERVGFEIVAAIRGRATGGLTREQHAERWRAFPDEDLDTQTGFIIARRRG
jgi:methyltransferase family protein